MHALDAERWGRGNYRNRCIITRRRHRHGRRRRRDGAITRHGGWWRRDDKHAAIVPRWRKCRWWWWRRRNVDYGRLTAGGCRGLRRCERSALIIIFILVILFSGRRVIVSRVAVEAGVGAVEGGANAATCIWERLVGRPLERRMEDTHIHYHRHHSPRLPHHQPRRNCRRTGRLGHGAARRGHNVATGCFGQDCAMEKTRLGSRGSGPGRAEVRPCGTGPGAAADGPSGSLVRVEEDNADGDRREGPPPNRRNGLVGQGLRWSQVIFSVKRALPMADIRNAFSWR